MHESKPFFGVQFHPEVGPGPTDTEVCQKDEVYYILKLMQGGDSLEKTLMLENIEGRRRRG